MNAIVIKNRNPAGPVLRILTLEPERSVPANHAYDTRRVWSPGKRPATGGSD